MSQKLLAPPKRESINPVLLKRLSFSHFVELIKINDPLKRQFYETECMQGIWSVRELKRQIASQYYERSALSTDKEGLAQNTQATTTALTPAQAVKDYYVFEFLDLPHKHQVSEHDLETALLDNLQ